MKSTWLYSCGEVGVGGRVKFPGAKKCMYNGVEINILVTLAVSNALNLNKKFKAKADDE